MGSALPKFRGAHHFVRTLWATPLLRLPALTTVLDPRYACPHTFLRYAGTRVLRLLKLLVRIPALKVLECL